MNIKNKILNCFAIAFISTLFIFAFTWIIFDFQGSTNSLKDTWSITSSLFGGIATLTATYIASLLFNDWKEQHNKEIRNKFSLQVYDSFIILTNLILDYGLLLETIQPAKKTSIPFLATKKSKELLISFQELNILYDKINIQLSYLFDRLREFGVISEQEYEIQTYIQHYLKIYKIISENNMSDVQTIEDTILTYNKIYDDYCNLRNKIYTLTIQHVIKDLQVKNKITSY